MENDSDTKPSTENDTKSIEVDTESKSATDHETDTENSIKSPTSPKQSSLSVCAQCGKSTDSTCVCHLVAYCSKDCQKQQWKEHKPHCLPFAIKKCDKGYGMFATRNLKAGSIVVAEHPIMAIDVDDQRIGLMEFIKFYKKIDYKDRQKLLKLSICETDDSSILNEELTNNDPVLDEVTKVWKIFASNSVQVCEAQAIWSPTEGAVYEKISRINHSCRPNCVWSWTKEDPRKKVVRCMTNVNKGEEILCNYIDIEDFNYGSRSYRQSRLKSKFGFLCACSECRLDEEESNKGDSIRMQIVSNLHYINNNLMSFERDKLALVMMKARQTEELIIKAGILLELPRFYITLYQLSIAVQSMGVHVGNPDVYAAKSKEASLMYGDSYLYFHNFVMGRSKTLPK